MFMRARRIMVLGIAIATLATGCGNSDSDQRADETDNTGGGPATTVSQEDLQKNVPVKAPGVTDDQIGVAVITSTTNILGGRYGEFADGIQAYFDYMNDQGGIYGRQLKILKHRDDQMLQNRATVKASLSQDNAFATFNAGPVFDGASELARSNPPMPTFIWNIAPEMAGKKNIFGTVGALCFNCIGQGGPFLAKTQNKKHVGVLAYGSTPSSKECGSAVRRSFEKYPVATVEFFDNNIAFAQPDLSSQVTEMKRKNVDIVFICMDGKEALILAKEMRRQGLDAPVSLPNAYDHEYIRENADLLEGYFVAAQFVPFEKQPPLPEHALIRKWVGERGKTIRELTIEGWIAAMMFVHGLKLAGPEFSQQKVIDALNRETNFTANGMKVPIDWTKQHDDPRTKPESRSKYVCASQLQIRDGQFVPIMDQPGKPWTCLVGGQEPPTLTETPTYESFAPAQ
jgi:branched-chain amino acid transport system substrate-binding protein